MKKILIALLLFTAAASAGNSDDMQQLQDYGYVGSSTKGGLYFARWHDKQSGVEFICAENSRWNNDSSVSCFPTGRNWK